MGDLAFFALFIMVVIVTAAFARVWPGGEVGTRFGRADRKVENARRA
jgi:hypothetical protein